MEEVLNFICNHAENAHLFLFSLLMLAGLSLPISEDLILLTGGAMASRCTPDNIPHFFLWIYFGCWISAWEAYWIGRLLGPRLFRIKWFHHILSPKRTEKLHHYYEKFGIFTFIVGRFIPGGVRNALFMTSGLGKMPFLKFIMRDGLACFFSTSAIFYIGYKFGENFETLIKHAKLIESIALIIVTSLIIFLLAFLFYQNRKQKGNAPKGL